MTPSDRWLLASLGAFLVLVFTAVVSWCGRM